MTVAAMNAESVRNVLRTRESNVRRALSRWAEFPKNLVRDSRERPAPNTTGRAKAVATPEAAWYGSQGPQQLRPAGRRPRFTSWGEVGRNED